MPSSTDRIEKSIVLPAPRTRVWRAITDVREFNTWFGVELTTPFTSGAMVSGRITIPNYDHLVMTLWVEAMEPESSMITKRCVLLRRLYTKSSWKLNGTSCAERKLRRPASFSGGGGYAIESVVRVRATGGEMRGGGFLR